MYCNYCRWRQIWHLRKPVIFRFIGGTYGRIIGRAMVDIFGVHSEGLYAEDFCIFISEIPMLELSTPTSMFLRRQQLKTQFRRDFYAIQMRGNVHRLRVQSLSLKNIALCNYILYNHAEFQFLSCNGKKSASTHMCSTPRVLRSVWIAVAWIQQ